MRSFRLKLTLLMILVPGSIVLALGAVASWLLSEKVLEGVDARMSLPASAFSRQASPWMDTEDFQRLTERFTDPRGSKVSRLGWVVVIRNDSAEIISESQEGLATQLALVDILPLPQDLVEGPSFLYEQEQLRRPPRARAEERPPPPRSRNTQSHLHRPPLFFTAETGDHRWRVGAFSSLFATVFVGMDLSPFDAQMARLRLRCLMAVLGALALTAVAGWMLANKAIRPVHRIAETAENITAKGLHERIPLTGREDREFARLVHVLNDMMERLERSFHHAVRFSADASHELRTPLAVMQGELERGLKHCPEGSAQERSLVNLSEETHRLKKITEALLTLSRADAGSLQLSEQPFSLSEALEAFCEDAQILCEEKQLSFQASIEPGLAIRADRPVILSVLHNLLSNAIKYNHDEGEVQLRATRKGRFANIEIANTGPSIPPTQRRQIFRRFYRGDDARSRRKDGFGLGLNIAQELIHASGGTLRLLDATSQDTLTRFAITLPREETNSPGKAEATASRASA